MASNNNTEVVNGVVQPRFYQVYGDLIESKEIMEPLAISAGTGPICGFDWVDTSRPNVTITSIFKTNSGAKGLSMLKGKSRRVFLSDKNNNAGQVFNAYTTPDGLCHIAPDILTFNGMQPNGGWPSTTNPTKLVSFVVKASHTYKPNNSETPPSLANFTCNWLTIGEEVSLSSILALDYDGLLGLLSNSGVSFNKNTEVIIGVYLVGWLPYWNTSDVQYKNLMASINYTLCLVPTDGRLMGQLWNSNPMDFLYVKEEAIKSSGLINSHIEIDTHNLKVVATGTASGSNYVLDFSELRIYNCNLLNSEGSTSPNPFQISIPLTQMLSIDGLGIISKVSLDDIKKLDKLSVINWTVAGITRDSSQDSWDGTMVSKGDTESYPNLVAIFDYRATMVDYSELSAEDTYGSSNSPILPVGNNKLGIVGNNIFRDMPSILLYALADYFEYKSGIIGPITLNADPHDPNPYEGDGFEWQNPSIKIWLSPESINVSGSLYQSLPSTGLKVGGCREYYFIAGDDWGKELLTAIKYYSNNASKLWPFGGTTNIVLGQLTCYDQAYSPYQDLARLEIYFSKSLNGTSKSGPGFVLKLISLTATKGSSPNQRFMFSIPRPVVSNNFSYALRFLME